MYLQSSEVQEKQFSLQIHLTVLPTLSKLSSFCWIPLYVTCRIRWNLQGILASVAREDVKQNVGLRAWLVGIRSLGEVNQDRNTQPREEFRMGIIYFPS